jgi:toxin ParE1/3/4
MTRYRVSKHAKVDLDEIYNYVAAANATAAERLLATFKEKFRLLGTRPLLGQMRSDLAAGLRCFTAGSYVIFYTVQPPGVEIVRVIHGARNVEAQFESYEDLNPEPPE